MNLQGKTVRYNLPEGKRYLNNHQATCPAIVVTDWGHEGNEPIEKRLLNLKILLDSTEIDWDTSVCHASVIEAGASWQLYAD